MRIFTSCGYRRYLVLAVEMIYPSRSTESATECVEFVNGRASIDMEEGGGVTRWEKKP